jgi:chitodextrinase
VSLTSPVNGATVAGTVTVSANASDDSGGSGIAKVDFFVDGALKGTDSSGSSPYTLSLDTTTLTSGSHTIGAKAYDVAGNATSATNISVTTSSGDTTAPKISSVATSGITSSSVTLTWLTDELGDTRAGYGTTTSYDTYAGDYLKDYSTNHSLTLTGLTAGTTYHYYVASKDTSGNVGKSGDYTFTTQAAGDTTPPTMSLTGVTAGATISGAVKIGATAADNKAVTKVEFYLDGALYSTQTVSPYCMADDISGVCQGWNSGSIANGPHSVIGKAYDAAGNIASSSVAFTVQNGDTTAPTTPTNVKATALSATQVSVSWTASTDNVGVTGYCVTRNGISLGCPGTTSTTYTDSTALPSTAYSFVVTARDAAGNFSAASSAASVTTPSAPDTAAPSVPANLSATAVSTSQINLSWTASTDNIGVAGYDVYRGSTKVATVTSTSFGDSGLSAGTTYSYTVVAKDAAGNASAHSAAVSATTQALPPTVTTGSLTGVVSTSSGPLSGATITISFSGTNHNYSTNSSGLYTITNVPVSQYPVDYSAKKLSSQTVAVTISSGSTTTTNVTLTKGGTTSGGNGQGGGKGHH